MSVLRFGVSHRSAPVSVLEQLSTDESDQAKIVDQVLQSPLVTEAMVLATCNRVEGYAVVDAFHGGLSAIGQVLAEHSGMSMGDLTKYAYVRYSEAAVEHLFAVASGLDSAVIGEQQVLGQVRRAYASAEANQTVGRVLHDLAQRALSVGKRVHSETAIDAAGASVVSVALGIAGARLDTGLAGRTAAVVGAGSMGGLSVAHLVRAGVSHIHVVNRSLPRAQRLAASIREQGVGAEAMELGFDGNRGGVGKRSPGLGAVPLADDSALRPHRLFRTPESDPRQGTRTGVAVRRGRRPGDHLGSGSCSIGPAAGAADAGAGRSLPDRHGDLQLG